MGTRAASFFILLVMTWTALWCCCASPVNAAMPQATAGQASHAMACCAGMPCGPDGMPTDSAGNPTSPADAPIPTSPACPIIQLREASLAPTPLALPAIESPLALLPSWFAVPDLTRPAGLQVAPGDRFDPPFRLPTALVELHTSLVT